MEPAFSPFVYVLAFIAMVLAVQGAASVFFSQKDRTERTNRRLSMLASGLKQSEVYAALVRHPIGGSGGNTPVHRMFNAFALYCQQSGLEMSPLRIGMLFGIAAVLLWLTSFFLLRSGNFSGLVMNAVIALPASLVICGAALWVWLSRKRASRLKQIEMQMPLALDVVNRALRAGHPVVAAVRLAGEEMGDPIGSEFGIIVDETTYGYEFRDALTNFARRTGSPDAHFFSVSIGVQSETGGNLTEILEGLAAVIRSRVLLGKRVRALSSEGRASAIMLSVLPVFVIGFMLLTRPDYYSSKFSDPVFWPIATGVFLLYLGGLMLIRRIINFRY